jgi:hypothetical protein
VLQDLMHSLQRIMRQGAKGHVMLGTQRNPNCKMWPAADGVRSRVVV